jgi:hypothetical protein
MKLRQLLIIAIVFTFVQMFAGQTAHAAIPRPDLTITSISSQFSSGNWFMVYTVKNIGTANAGPFYIKIQRGNVAETEFNTAGLAIGASRVYWQRMPICEFTRTIILDSRIQIVESNEANNSRAFTNFC